MVVLVQLLLQESAPLRYTDPRKLPSYLVLYCWHLSSCILDTVQTFYVCSYSLMLEPSWKLGYHSRAHLSIRHPGLNHQPPQLLNTALIWCCTTNTPLRVFIVQHILLINYTKSGVSLPSDVGLRWYGYHRKALNFLYQSILPDITNSYFCL